MGLFHTERTQTCVLPAARECDVFTGVCHYVHYRPHGYSITAHPCCDVVSAHPTAMLPC